uniref:Uncharacterized protein n=1 Tax=Arundo donax TaxID=35708 RepID=A0A0A8Z2Y7_ARUDO
MVGCLFSTHNVYLNDRVHIDA